MWTTSNTLNRLEHIIKTNQYRPYDIEWTIPYDMEYLITTISNSTVERLY